MEALKSQIDGLFDYCGDLSKIASSGTTKYHADYSPNNIKRVVVSPNGVFVNYHKPVGSTNNRSYKYVEFNERTLFLEEQEQGYKPILSRLATRVCSSVEEIIILTQSLSGQMHPGYTKEGQLETLISSFKGEGSTLEEKIKNRYKRLRYFTTIPIHFKSFLTFYQNISKSGELRQLEFLSEHPAVKQTAVTIKGLAGADYWKYWGSRKDSYQFDVTLSAHFSAIEQKREAELKAKAVSAVRDKRVGGKVTLLNDMIDECILFARTWDMFYRIISIEGTNGVLPDLSFVHRPEQLQLMPFKGMHEPKGVVLLQGGSETEAFEKDETVLKSYRAKCSRALATDFLTALEKVEDRQYMLKTLLKDCETTIAVPPELIQASQSLGVVFDGKDLRASVVNCCWQFMRFFVDCKDTRPFTREYWDSRWKKGAA